MDYLWDDINKYLDMWNDSAAMQILNKFLFVIYC